ncbi:hypothetical protein R1flu_007008 [Riccia fluitans]|uniref:Exonuclease 1 n=1 Tax=Riccia fluitans TaxID=41844 RepID=A0ABD1Z0B6_9MARC
MGIQGLLQALKPYAEPAHVKKYAGKRVGIDAYSWLHKGAYGCGMELQLTDSESEKRKVPLYVSYCMHRIKMLLYNKVTPVVVFDGGPLPLKAATQQERRRRREVNLENAQRKHADGDMSGAQELYQRAVEITPAMAHQLIEVLREQGIEFVVAPYEADAQLAYLASLPMHKGGVAAVISEDSDLLAYGCQAVLFKMDRYGHGEEIRMKNLFECDPPPLKALSFKGFTQDLFLCMCVMAGCDFLSSIPGIGVKRAHGLLAKYRNVSRVLSKLKLERPTTFPENYMADFSQAKAIFCYARVYDREKRELVLLNPLPEELTEEFEGNFDFLGPDLPRSRAKAIAEGRLDPVTMEAFSFIPSPIAVALASCGSEELRKDSEFSPAPIKPFSMYGPKKESPKLPSTSLLFSPKSLKPPSSPASPSSMIASKKATLRIFDSSPVRSLRSLKDNESSESSNIKVETTQMEFAASSTSEIPRSSGEMDDSSEASQLTVSYEQTISETHASYSGATRNETMDVDQTFLEQLMSVAGQGSEAPTQTSSTTSFVQSIKSERGIRSNNPFKRKMMETYSESFHSTAHKIRASFGVEVRKNAEELGPTEYHFAEVSTLLRLRETPTDERECGTTAADLDPQKEEELASPADSVFAQSADGVDESPSSVLTEISLNFEAAEISPADTVASGKLSSSPPGGPSAGKLSVKCRVMSINRSTSSVQNGRSRGGARSKIQSPSPANPLGGGILKFFKPVSQ